MKKQSLTKGCFRNTLLSLIILINISINLVAQTNSPVIQWGKEYNHFQNSSDNTKNSLDWALQNIQAKDGSFLACGFTSRWDGDGLAGNNNFSDDVTKPVGGCHSYNRPSIVKLNSSGTLLWKYAFDEGHPENGGKFQDIIEIENNHFVAVGEKSSTTNTSVYIVEIDQFGSLVRSKIFNYANNGSWCRGGSLCRGYNNSGNPEGYVITGEYVNGTDHNIFLMKIDDNFTSTFTSGSVEWYRSFGTQYDDRGYCVRPYFTNGINPDGSLPSGSVCNGYLVTGQAGTSDGHSDIWVAKTDLSGVTTGGSGFWETTIDQASFGHSFDPSQAPCSFNLQPNSSDVGRWVEETQNGDIILSAFGNLYLNGCGSPGGCSTDYNGNTFPNNTIKIGAYEYYQQTDIFLVRLNATNSILASTFLHHMSGADFIPTVKETYDNGFVVIGTTANPYDEPGVIGNNVESKLILIKTNAALTVQWKKLFLAPGDDECACGFGLCVTNDGGYLACGNNGNQNDNYVFVKLSGDCEVNTALGSNDVIDQYITASETWSSNKKVTGTVIVNSGAILTINNNATIQFGSYNDLYGTDNVTGRSTPYSNYNHVGLVIKPGGRIVVNGATLTSIQSACPNAKWDGILLEGDRSKNQYPTSNQGILDLNNAIIENAKVGVTTNGIQIINNQYRIDYAKAGGIIYAINSTFRNNNMHVAFYDYIGGPSRQNNISSFNNCIFEIAGSTDITELGYNNKGVMIRAWDVKGVRFSGCTFRNTNGSVNADKMNFDRGTGIFALDAALVVNALYDPNCQKTSGYFYDLSKGIFSSFSPYNTSGGDIRQQLFERNDKGIWLLNGLSCNIHHNTFDLYVPSNYWMRSYSPYDYMLLYSGIAGIIAKDAAGYRLEENNFTNSSALYGNTGALTSGEIVVATVLDNSDAGGGGAIVRKNTHTSINIGSQTQLDNLAAQLTCNSYSSIYSAIKMNPVISGNTPSFGNCLSVPFDYGNLYYNNRTYDVENDLSLTKDYIVVNPSASTSPNKPLNMTFTNCNGSANGYIDPNCPSTLSFQDNCPNTWDNPDPNTSQYYYFKQMKAATQDIIENGNLSDDELALAQSNLLYYFIETKHARNNVLWAYNMSALYDSTFNCTDSILAFLIPETDKDSRKMLVATYYNLENDNAALAFLDSIGNDSMDNETVQFKLYYNLLINARANGRNVFELNESEWNTITSIASTNTSASEAAKGILSMVKGLYFNSYIERNTEQFGKRSVNVKSGIIKKTPISEILQPGFSIYPNPTSNSLLVSYVLNEYTDKVIIKLIDITGRIILSKSSSEMQANVEVNTTLLNNGMYFIQLISNDKIISVQKIVI
ncbi:MAG: T9SS type A sorting domain-containing protein, partial [Bacteroidota bacterium]